MSTDAGGGTSESKLWLSWYEWVENTLGDISDFLNSGHSVGLNLVHLVLSKNLGHVGSLIELERVGGLRFGRGVGHDCNSGVGAGSFGDA